MSKHSPRTSTEARATWLKNNRAIWKNVDPKNPVQMVCLAAVMQTHGLYSKTTNRKDIARSLKPLLARAKEEK